MFALNLIVTLLLVTTIAHAQQKQISGQFKNASGKVIPDATVLLANNQGLIVQYGNSDGSGTYISEQQRHRLYG